MYTLYTQQITQDGLLQRQCMVTLSISYVSGTLIGTPGINILLYHAQGLSLKFTTIHARAWKNKLRAVKPENQVEVYQTLSLLAKETDVSVFQKRLSSFIQLWMPIESNFVTYFMQYYQNQTGMYNAGNLKQQLI